MTTTTIDFEKASQKIIRVLRNRSDGKEGEELIRYIYNQAVDDAANFLHDLAPQNPMQSSALLGAEKEVRHWLRLR